MGARQYLPEIVFGTSSFVFVAGAVANILSSHIGVDDGRVQALTGQRDAIVSNLNQSFPTLEAINAEKPVTVVQAQELGATSTWFAEHDQLAQVDGQLTEAKHGNDTLHGLGWTGIVAGGFGAFVSGQLVPVNYNRRKRDYRWRTEDQLQALEADRNLKDNIFGLEPADDLPELAVSPRDLAPFTRGSLKEGLNHFITLHKRDRPDDALFLYDLARKASDGDDFDQLTMQMLAGLFTSGFQPDDQYEGSIDARAFGDRLKHIVTNYASWLTLMRPADRLDEASQAEVAEGDPEDIRFHIPVFFAVLDRLLPLDQHSSHNPQCAGDEHAGSHWIDFVEKLARRNELAEAVPLP